MNLLVDTHILLWWVNDDVRFTDAMNGLLIDPSNQIFLSSVTVFEIATKYKLGKLKLPTSAEEAIDLIYSSRGLLELPILHSHSIRAGNLPLYHRDPFDRLLIGQALVEDMAIVTTDHHFTAYEIRTIA